MATCRRCGADIVWKKMTSGKNMPCNPEPQAGTQNKRVVNQHGQLVAEGEGYLPHWKDCEDAVGR